MMTAIPARASDAGPDETSEQKDWLDLLFDAGEEVTLARSYRLERDDPDAQRKLRLEAIDRARTALDQAEALLRTPPKPPVEPEDYTGEDLL